MKKIKMTSDTLMQIIKKVFQSADFIIEDNSAWHGMTATEALNLELYTFKHRLRSAEDYLESISKSLKTSYGLVELSSVERLYSKDIDHLTISGSLTTWIQTEKIKLLEELIDSCNILLCGEVSSVKIDLEERNILFQFGVLSLQSVQTQTEIGEAVIVAIPVTMELAPSITSYNDYLIELSFDGSQYLTVPFTSWVYSYNTSQTPIPLVNQSNSGFINTTQSNNISLSLYDFNKPLTRQLREIALGCNAMNNKNHDLNEPMFLRITIMEDDAKEFWLYKVTPKTITISGINMTFNPMSVVFAPWGEL